MATYAPGESHAAPSFDALRLRTEPVEVTGPLRLGSAQASRRRDIIAPPQQLCSVSSVGGDIFLPSGAMFHHAVQDGQELPHACGQGDFLCFAGGTEAGIERPNDRIEAARGELILSKD